MRRAFWVALALAATVATTTPAAELKVFDPAPFQNFVKEKTVRAEVVAALGQPTKEQATPDGGAALIYPYQTKVEGMSEIVVVAFFGPDGKYKGIEVFKKDE